MITWKELRVKSMPPEKEASAKKDWIAHYVLRPVSDIMTLPCLSWNITATAVTKFSLIPVLFALFAGVFGDGTLWFVIAWFGLFFWNLLDGVDGNIARYTDTCSLYGSLWDAAVGYLAMFVHFFIMGIMAYKADGTTLFLNSMIPAYAYIIMGALAGLSMIFPRLITQKKQTLFNEEAVQGVKQRSDFGCAKTLVLNLMSINGVGQVLFLIAILTGLLNICMFCYFALNTLFALVSLYGLLHE